VIARRSLLLLVLLLGCAATPDAGPVRASLRIVHARIYGHPEARTLEITGDRITALTASPGETARTIDAGGAWVIPGIHDAHVHLLSGGLEAEGVALGACETLESALAAVASFARAHPDEAWIEGGGWAYSIVPRGKFPGRADLDRVVPDRPVILSSFDGHTAWANTRALELARVGAETPDPAGGRIVREEDGKTPAGALLEGAAGLVWRAAPLPTREKKLAVLEGAARRFAALGVTSIDDIEREESTLELLAELDRRGALPIRVRVALPLEGDLARYDELRKKYASPRVRFGFLKGFVDGVVESRTAYLLEPYAGSTDRGSPILGPPRLDALVLRAHAAGYPVALHAIGDAAVRISLDAFEAATRKHPEVHLPHRIEHIEVLGAGDAARFARLGVIASMQPFHALPEPETEVWSTNLGKERLPRTFAWRDLLDAGATLVFGSDWPVASANPLLGLAVAITRKDKDGNPPGGWNARQAITLPEALHAYTSGTLDPGSLADVAILSSGVDLDDPATLWTGRVEATIVGGNVVGP
jgi:predicted amidohydrolase YtcJ